MTVPPPPPLGHWEYRLVKVHEAARLAKNENWQPVPEARVVYDQTRGYVGSTTYVWIKKLKP